MNLKICKNCKCNYIKFDCFSINDNIDLWCMKSITDFNIINNNTYCISHISQQQVFELCKYYENKSISTNPFGSMFHLDKDNKELQKIFENISCLNECPYYLEHQLYDLNKGN